MLISIYIEYMIVINYTKLWHVYKKWPLYIFAWNHTSTIHKSLGLTLNISIFNTLIQSLIIWYPKNVG